MTIQQLPIICGWCQKHLGEKEGIPEKDITYSGICNDCLNYNFPHHADRIRAALEVENIDDIYKLRKEVH